MTYLLVLSVSLFGSRQPSPRPTRGADGSAGAGTTLPSTVYRPFSSALASRSSSRSIARSSSAAPLRWPCRHRPFRSPAGAPARAPCIRQTSAPLTAGARHRRPLRFERAWQRGARFMSETRCMGLMLAFTTRLPWVTTCPSPLPHPHADRDIGGRTRVGDRPPVLGRAAATVPGQRLDALAGRLRQPHRREPAAVAGPVRPRLREPG